LDQRYDALSLAVKVTEPPSQNVVGPLAVTAGMAAAGCTVTVIGAEAEEQPFAVMVTV
jgi:hypothetical protein